MVCHIKKKAAGAATAATTAATEGRKVCVCVYV